MSLRGLIGVSQPCKFFKNIWLDLVGGGFVAICRRERRLDAAYLMPSLPFDASATLRIACSASVAAVGWSIFPTLLKSV